MSRIDDAPLSHQEAAILVDLEQAMLQHLRRERALLAHRHGDEATDRVFAHLDLQREECLERLAKFQRISLGLASRRPLPNVVKNDKGSGWEVR